ncbi:ketopantoate reductase family protein [Agaribacter flavus]|uniref:2-dehydropantoate 2-reductase n=1 Tax=Agaribacter flavus TaxID=1902781 RepID=A0ABV7FM37_9ALTE
MMTNIRAATKKIGIVGFGCIGSYLCYLLDDKQTKVFVRRTASPIKPTLSVDGERKALKTQRCYFSEKSLHALDLLIVPVKSYQNAELIKQLRPILPQSIPILILQNGISGIEEFRQAFPYNEIFAGISTDGLYRQSIDSVVLAGRGKLLIGQIQDKKQSCKGLASAKKLMSRHPHGEWSDNIKEQIYQKLLVNCVINPLTFLYDCKNGEVVKYTNECEEIINEVLGVFAHERVHISPDSALTRVLEVIRATAKNTSSMLQDKLGEKPTEIDAILGAIIQKANHYQCPVKKVEQLYQAVKQQEQRYLNTANR